MRRPIVGLLAALASAGLMAPAGRHSSGRTTRTAGKRKPARKRLQMARELGIATSVLHAYLRGDRKNYPTEAA